MHLKLSTDRKFALSDENYLFDCMGLTKTTSDELSRMFEPKICEFLKQSELVQALPKEANSKPAAEGQEIQCEEVVAPAKLAGQNTHTPITKYLPAMH